LGFRARGKERDVGKRIRAVSEGGAERQDKRRLRGLKSPGTRRQVLKARERGEEGGLRKRRRHGEEAGLTQSPDDPLTILLPDPAAGRASASTPKKRLQTQRRVEHLRAQPPKKSVPILRGSGISEHNRRRIDCKPCGRSNICEHNVSHV
jgi:hypothetical protein